MSGGSAVEHCPSAQGSRRARDHLRISSRASARAGGLAEASGVQALGAGTEAGPSLSLLGGRMQMLGTLAPLTVRRASGTLPLAGRWGLKAPHNSGLAPHAAESGSACLLGQGSQHRWWAQGATDVLGSGG